MVIGAILERPPFRLIYGSPPRLIIKPLHNASCWNLWTLRPLWFGFARHQAHQLIQPTNLLADSKFARKNLKKQLRTKIFWISAKKLRNYHALNLSQANFESRKPQNRVWENCPVHRGICVWKIENQANFACRTSLKTVTELRGSSEKVLCLFYLKYKWINSIYLLFVLHQAFPFYTPPKYQLIVFCCLYWNLELLWK